MFHSAEKPEPPIRKPPLPPLLTTDIAKLAELLTSVQDCKEMIAKLSIKVESEQDGANQQPPAIEECIKETLTKLVTTGMASSLNQDKALID
eukprot:scaffold355161_cov18-Prasinocladus_malaysianus.AAC.1